MVKWIVCLLCLLQPAYRSIAQGSYDDRAKAYIRTYAAYAIEDQRNSGVPAAITLGQGILETEAGKSELAVKANNHFGIKCKNGWDGPTFLHTDDARNECFKKYGSALESYNDHSAHLHRNPRYKSLFTYSPVDYRKWAHGLKRCGYATNPKYAYQLIKIIEDYNLQEFTYAAVDSNYHVKAFDTGENTVVVAAANDQQTDEFHAPAKIKAAKEETSMARAVDSARDAIRTNENEAEIAEQWAVDNASEILTVNGLRAVYCHKEQPLLPIAIAQKMRYAHLLEINDLPDEPMPFDGYVYLEKKRATGTKEQHIVKEGETLLMIAQLEGIQLKKLTSMNHLTVFEQPETGVSLNLQAPSAAKPALRRSSGIKVYSEAEIAAVEKQNPDTPAATNQWGEPVVKSQQQASFGMSFEAPKEDVDESATGAESSYSSERAKPQGKREIRYTVKRGETAFSIAKRYGVTVQQLASWNKIDARHLNVGQVLRIKNQ